MKGGTLKLTAKTASHYMQSLTWAEVRRNAGWKHHTLSFKDTNILVYFRPVPTLGYLYYIPGLDGVTQADVGSLTRLLRLNCKKGFAVRLELNQHSNEELIYGFIQTGWKYSRKHMQYRHTVIIDLKPSENDIWMSLKSRGRYEIQQAKKAGVKVTKVEATDTNLVKMYDLMQATSKRNRFYIRDKNFTFSYWHNFLKSGKLQLWFAYHEDDLIAGAVVLTQGKHAWYKDGGSTREKSNLMAARLLQWEIIRHLHNQKFTQYDLSGIPDPEKHQASSMHGIYVFKSAFSKENIALMPTLELPLSTRYKLWPRIESNWLRTYNLFARNLWY